MATSAVSNLIREGKTNQLRNAMQMSLGAGSQTLEMSLNELVSAGLITQETAVGHGLRAPRGRPHRRARDRTAEHHRVQPVTRRGRCRADPSVGPVRWR